MVEMTVEHLVVRLVAPSVVWKAAQTVERKVDWLVAWMAERSEQTSAVRSVDSTVV
jgi:hypothetical protein